MNLLDFMMSDDTVVVSVVNDDDDVKDASASSKKKKEEEIWKPLVRYGKEVPGYMVSTYGRFLGKRNKIMKPNYNATGGYAKHQIYVPKGFFGSDYEYHRHITMRVHRAVMETHRPIKDNPPFNNILTEEYENCSGAVKEWIDNANHWIAATAYIDHIDDDVRNNHVSNLRWVTPKQNQIHHKANELGVPFNPRNYNNIPRRPEGRRVRTLKGKKV